jgi:hypothetical protein
MIQADPYTIDCMLQVTESMFQAASIVGHGISKSTTEVIGHRYETNQPTPIVH